MKEIPPVVLKSQFEFGEAKLRCCKNSVRFPLVGSNPEYCCCNFIGRNMSIETLMKVETEKYFEVKDLNV